MSQSQPNHIPGSRTEALREKCRALLQEIRNEYIVDTKWHFPFPSVPATQLIYVPNRVRDIFCCPATSIQPSDIDAMAFGILERLNLNYFATQPHDMKQVRDAVAAAEREYEDLILEQNAKGQAINPLPKLVERYHNLDPEDADLVEEDLGVNPLDRDTLPTATLMKNHIYTELGRTPLQRRADQRLAAPFARFGLGSNNSAGNSNSINNNSNNNSMSMMNNNNVDRGSQVSAFMMSMSQASNNNNNNSAARQQQQQQQQEVLSAEEMWVRKVNMSFKNVKQLDNLFAAFLDRIALDVLGLKSVREEDDPSPTSRLNELQAQEAIRAFTKLFVQLVLEVVPVSNNLANKLVERVRSLVAGEVEVEGAQSELENDWSFAANESEVLLRTAQIRDRFLHESLNLFSEYELTVKDKPEFKPYIKFSKDRRLKFGDGTDFTNITSMLRSIHGVVNPQNQGVINLVNPENTQDVPVAILPVIPASRKQDAPAASLTARVLLNVHQDDSDEDDNPQRQEEKRRKALLAPKNSNSDKNRPYHPAVMFGEELLLRPDPRAPEKDNNDVMQYKPESSAFEVLREEENSDGIYILKVGQDAARFARVPRTVEMVRKIGTEMHSSEIEPSTVVWEDAAK